MSASSGIPSARTRTGFAKLQLDGPSLDGLSLDEIVLGGPLLQEVVAAPGEVCTAAAFSLALIARRQRTAGQGGAREIAWLQQEALAIDTGEPLGQGLAALGIDPGRLIFVRLRTGLDVLRAGLEAARCAALGAVIIELVKPIDLTASRRLKLAAEKSGVPLLLLRHPDAVASNAASNPVPNAAPNAAQVRFRVGAAPSAPNPGNANAHVWGQPACDAPLAFDVPAFDVTVLKHPSGLSQTRFLMEWDRDRHAFHTFAPALPRPVAAVPVSRPLAA